MTVVVEKYDLILVYGQLPFNFGIFVLFCLIWFVESFHYNKSHNRRWNYLKYRMYRWKLSILFDECKLWLHNSIKSALKVLFFLIKYALNLIFDRIIIYFFFIEIDNGMENTWIFARIQDFFICWFRPNERKNEIDVR